MNCCGVKPNQIPGKQNDIPKVLGYICFFSLSISKPNVHKQKICYSCHNQLFCLFLLIFKNGPLSLTNALCGKIFNLLKDPNGRKMGIQKNEVNDACWLLSNCIAQNYIQTVFSWLPKCKQLFTSFSGYSTIKSY